MANCETELLETIRAKGPLNPYQAVSGMVRMSAVDRWVNNLVRCGYVEISEWIDPYTPLVRAVTPPPALPTDTGCGSAG